MQTSSIFQDKSMSFIEKPKDANAEIAYQTLEFEDEVLTIETSPFLLSHDLIGVALPDKIIIGQLVFSEENDYEVNEVRFTKIEEIPIKCDIRVHNIRFSPDTNIKMAPKTLIFAYSTSASHSTSDYQLVIAHSDLSSSSHKPSNINSMVINSHKSYINDFAYRKEGSAMASCGDDFTCRIWLPYDSYKLYCKFILSSPGMSVCWNHEDSEKLLVGEKSGTITLFNVLTRQTVLSLRSHTTPLMSMDWSVVNPAYVGAICGGNLLFWCLTNPSAPIVDKTVHLDGGSKVKFFPLSEFKLITLGAHDNSLKVHQANPSGVHPTCLTSTLEMCTGLTCHHHLPYAFTSSDNFVNIWKLPA